MKILKRTTTIILPEKVIFANELDFVFVWLLAVIKIFVEIFLMDISGLEFFSGLKPIKYDVDTLDSIRSSEDHCE